MKVCIFDEGFIPGLGRGPFRTPIEVTEDMYALYKRMGLKVINATKTVSIAESGVFNRVVKKSNKEEENIAMEETVEETTEETTNETVEEEVEETTNEVTDETVEEVVEEETTDETVEEVEINSLTKKELIKLLTENGIECNNNMTKAQLIKLFEEN